jgi:coenzyme F420 biosynthesis associated uncharacterized protein
VIDWILAEKIAALVAGRGEGASAPAVDLAELCSEAERRVVAYTGLAPLSPLPPAEGVSRREWVATNIRSSAALLDPVVTRAGKGLGPLRPTVQIALGLTTSTEVGLLIGYLAQRVLGQYEIVLLDEASAQHPPRLLFVLPNLAQAVSRLQANEREFMTWVALHEVTHAVQFGGVPWLQGHLAGLVRTLMDSAELRIASRRPRLPSRPERERMARSLRSGDLLGIVLSPAERQLVDRIQATMAVVEGHAEHVMDAVAPDLLPSLPQLRRSLDERRRTQSRISRLIGRLLGLELKLRQYERGKAFCDAVVADAGAQALRHVFSDERALPSLEEIESPASWLARTAAERGAFAPPSAGESSGRL